jgi:hypothetical protein
MKHVSAASALIGLSPTLARVKAPEHLCSIPDPLKVLKLKVNSVEMQSLIMYIRSLKQ